MAVVSLPSKVVLLDVDLVYRSESSLGDYSESQMALMKD